MADNQFMLASVKIHGIRRKSTAKQNGYLPANVVVITPYCTMTTNIHEMCVAHFMNVCRQRFRLSGGNN